MVDNSLVLLTPQQADQFNSTITPCHMHVTSFLAISCVQLHILLISSNLA